ncbi:hypothetical protein LV779_39290 [Streptomyces thinghirensis]|nr:hypothetical protein [Streptomyces thinghirensis]
MSSATPTSGKYLTPGRRLSLTGVCVCVGPPEIWFKPALSSVAAVAPPNLVPAGPPAGSTWRCTPWPGRCARFYAHNRPYAARAPHPGLGGARGMLGGVAVALVTASLTRDAVVLVTVGALLAAVQKAPVTSPRVGPPGNVVLTFIRSAAPVRPADSFGQIPGRLALAAPPRAPACRHGTRPGPPARPRAPATAAP